MTALLKTTYKIRAALLTLGTGLMICSSCTDEDFVKDPQNGDRMSFGISISDQWTAGSSTRSAEPQQPKYEAYQFDNSEKWVVAADEPCIDGASFGNTRPTTRAAEVSKDNFESTYPSFGVYAFASSTATRDDDWNQTDAGTKLYISGEQATDPTNDIWSTVDAHYWPGADYRMKFFAWAPYNNRALKVSLNADNTPEFEYIVPDDVSKQSDVLFATDINEGTKDSPNYKETVAGNYNQPVPLRFRHALTAVKVKAVGLEGTITTVTFSNIYNHGTLSFLGDAWEVDINSKTSFSANPNKELTGASDDEYIINDEYTFMMLPQELTAETKLEVAVTYKDGTTETLQGGIGGTTADGKKHVDWKMGRTVTYTISKTGEILQFYITDLYDNPIREIPFTKDGGKLQFKVYSFKGENGIPWEIERIEGNTDMFGWNQWWKNTNMSTGNGSVTGDVRGDYDVTAFQGYAATNPELNVSTEVGNANGIDLSYPIPADRNKEQTGEYLNKKYQTTANCYITPRRGFYKFPAVYGNAITNGENNKEAYSGYKDYNGNDITNPYIKDIDDLKVVWEDVPGLIHGLEYDKESNYISFRLRTEVYDGKYQNTYAQGNAVIAAYKDKNIVWSWHIWLCHYILGPIEPENLITRGNYSFLPYNLGSTGYVKKNREVIIHFVQKEGVSPKRVRLVLQQGDDNNVYLSASNLHYQWGRKDPFEYQCSIRPIFTTKEGGNIESISDTIRVMYDYLPNGNIQSAILNPNIFYTSSENWWSNDFTNFWRTNSGKKTIYDPCPRGFFVPTEDALKAIENVLPEVGMRNNQGSYSELGSYYWGADYKNGFPEHVSSMSGSFNPAYGFSIRPMKEPE